MEDTAIVDLYFSRSEEAIRQTDQKYGAYCYQISYNILGSPQDAEESVSDTYLAAWERIPPTRPAMLSAFLGKLARNFSIDRWRRRSAAKRGGGQISLALEELAEVIPGQGDPEGDYLRKEAAQALNRFLDALPEAERDVLLRRYWYLDSVADIARRYGFTEAKVKSMLCRSREKLRAHLQKEELL